MGDNRLLERNCSPNCKPESIDHVRRYYLISKVSLGVGVLALGGATYLYVKNLRSPSNEVASTRRPRYVLQVAPHRLGRMGRPVRLVLRLPGQIEKLERLGARAPRPRRPRPRPGGEGVARSLR